MKTNWSSEDSEFVDLFLQNPTIELYNQLGELRLLIAGVRIQAKVVYLAIADILQSTAMALCDVTQIIPAEIREFYESGDFSPLKKHAAKVNKLLRDAERSAQAKNAQSLLRPMLWAWHSGLSALSCALHFALNKDENSAICFFEHSWDGVPMYLLLKSLSKQHCFDKYFEPIRSHLPFSLFAK